jgi:thioester reductase-like protein
LRNERVEFLQADLQPELGLGPEKYAKLLNDTTVVIHNAWQVDFNIILHSFESQIRGVRNLLDFSAQSAHKAPLIFISSVSIAHGWMALHHDEMVPEAVLDDFDAPSKLDMQSRSLYASILSRISPDPRASQVLFCGWRRLRDRGKGMVYGIEMNGFQAL